MSSDFRDLRVLLLVERLVFRVGVSGVGIAVVIRLVVADVRGDRGGGAALRVGRLLRRPREVQLYLQRQRANTKRFMKLI